MYWCESDATPTNSHYLPIFNRPFTFKFTPVRHSTRRVEPTDEQKSISSSAIQSTSKNSAARRRGCAVSECGKPPNSARGRMAG